MKQHLIKFNIDLVHLTLILYVFNVIIILYVTCSFCQCKSMSVCKGKLLIKNLFPHWYLLHFLPNHHRIHCFECLHIYRKFHYPLHIVYLLFYKNSLHPLWKASRSILLSARRFQSTISTSHVEVLGVLISFCNLRIILTTFIISSLLRFEPDGKHKTVSNSSLSIPEP